MVVVVVVVVVMRSLVFRSGQYMTSLHSFGRENVFLNICEQRDMLVSLTVVFSLPIGMLDTIKGRLDLDVDMQLVFQYDKTRQYFYI